MVQLSANETNRFLNIDQNESDFNIDMDKTIKFFGLIFLSRYNNCLSERDYWSNNPDSCCDGFWEKLCPNRFFETKLLFHAANKNALKDSEIAKVKPLYNLLSKNLI